MKVDEAMKSRQIKTESSNFEKNERHAIVLISDQQCPFTNCTSIFKHFPRYQRDLRDSRGNNSLSAAIENAFKVCIGWNFWMELAKANI